MKRVGAIAGLLLFTLLLPMTFMGALLVLAGDQPSPSEKALEEIPADLIGTYQAAARTCEGLDWTILAAIHKVETGSGRSRATSSAGAQGPMQFMPQTFASYGVDGDGDGNANINNVTDAIFSAANYLCGNGAGNPEQLSAAIWHYNHSQAYVKEILRLASSYAVLTGPGGLVLASTDLLNNPRVILTPNARADLAAGIVDQRLVSLLGWIAQRHTISISVFKTGHSKYTRSGNVSLHFSGRAADIFAVDGRAVSSSNVLARSVIMEVDSIAGSARATEIGHPFDELRVSGGFTDHDHRDHLHLGFDK